MMKKLKIMLASLAMIAGLGVVAPVLVSTDVFAGSVNPANKAKEGVKEIGGTGSQNTDLVGFIQNIVNVLLFLIGAVSVIMIVIGGLKYVLSQGDQSSITSAKNTILYSVIGLVVALLAYAIVNFVIDGLAG